MLPKIFTPNGSAPSPMILSYLLLISILANAQKASSACDLLKPSELESVLGGKAEKFSSVKSGSTEFCSGTVGKLKVIVRTAERKQGSGNEAAIVESLKKQGWKIEVKKEGNMTLSTAISPETSQQKTYNTTASIYSNGKVLAVEASAAKKEEMASMDALGKLAKKACGRL